MQVALFITCFNDTLFPNVGIATTQLLERLGHTVDFPEAQTCCGQMHFNTGYQRESIPLVRHFVEVFRDAEIIVAPSASCVGMVRDLYPKAAALSGDTALVEAVEQLTPRVYELSEFLVKRLDVTDVGAYFPHRVTYHPTCHSLRVLHVGDAPLRLLRAVKGISSLPQRPVLAWCAISIPKPPRSLATLHSLRPSNNSFRTFTNSRSSWSIQKARPCDGVQSPAYVPSGCQNRTL